MSSTCHRLAIVASCAFIAASGFGIQAATAQQQCTTGDRWSLEAARQSLSAATALGQQMVLAHGESATCVGDAYWFCREIGDHLYLAWDHINQVFHQNHDYTNDCKLCDFDLVIQHAGLLVEWENWLWARHYGGAGGVGNAHLAISQRRDIPYCDSRDIIRNDPASAFGTQPAPSGTQSGATATQPDPYGGQLSGTAGWSHPCGGTSQGHRKDATWRWYTSMGAGESNSEYGGYICFYSGYYLLNGSSFQEYRCDSGHTNCQPQGWSAQVTEVKPNREKGYTTYFYSGSNGNGWGVRHPE